MLVLLSSCGGGGSSNSTSPPIAPDTEPPPQIEPSREEIAAASRFTAQATFGLAYEGIVEAAQLGNEEWLERQLALAPTRHTPIALDLVSRRQQGEFSEVEEDVELLVTFRRYSWWHNSITAPDEVRQRIALALSEIMVVSDLPDVLLLSPLALTTYYDVLLDGAFGNFRDLLRDVSLHPAMGWVLASRQRLAADGLPIPTYTSIDIREFAKIFTGLSWGGEDGFFGNPEPNFVEPMVMFDEFHEPGEKHLLRGAVVPAGQTGIADLDAAIDNLFNHPNVGPFIGRQLIQRLVTSNPSPAYINRVATVFNNNGEGVRGDMRAMVRAILLDPEAIAPSSPNISGKLREPLVRNVALLLSLIHI